MMKKISFFLLLSVLTFWTACQNVSKNDADIREQARQNLTAAKQEKLPENFNKQSDNNTVVQGPTTQVQFTDSKFDFGLIDEGKKVNHTFKFSNVGTEPLVISNAKASCGCTVPTYSKEPVAPGESGEIDVIFDSKGRPGKTNKTITITANTEPVKTVLYLTGEVKPKKK